MQVSPFARYFLRSGFTAGLLVLLAVGPLAAEEPASSGISAYTVSPALEQVLAQHRYFQPADPQDNPVLARRRWRRAWLASWAAFAVVNVLDMHSSAGKGELNPLLRNADGRFSTPKAALFKAGLGGGFMAFQGWMIKKNPDRNLYKPFTFATFGATGAMGAVAARNYGVPK